MTDVERLAELLREADYKLSDSADILAARLIGGGVTFSERKASKKIKVYLCNDCGAIRVHKDHKCIFGDNYRLIEGEAVFEE